MSDEFSCKFVDTQPKEMFQMLNKSFGILEDLSSTWHRSSQRERKCKVQKNYDNPKQSNADQSQAETDGPRKRISKGLLDKVLI